MREASSGQHDTNGPEALDATPLAGLTVIDVSTTAPGAQATQFLADAGADVVQVEPPGGSPLRELAGWPTLARGKRSIELDLGDETGRETLRGLIRCADVFVTTFRPRTAGRLGLAPTELARLNPRLVSAAITGWGSSGPWADLKGYEGMVMAKLGMFHAKRRIVTRPGPAFVTVPFATWGAGQTALHGILAALVERESSGRGQHVEADLVRGATTFDTWTWFSELIGARWPGAYETVDAFDPQGRPQSALTYPLLAAPTKDGHWLQFAQVEPRLFLGLLEELGLTPLLSDPKWKGLPVLESQELRTELWEIMIQKVGERTRAEWEQVFATNPNIMAEVFRSGRDAFGHPQLQYDGRVLTATDPAYGPVRQPSTLVHVDERPLSSPRQAPRLDQHGPELRDAATQDAEDGGPAKDAAAPPLQGVTILELGLMFAAPFGSALLADLGARVIKVESLTGDTIRGVLPFPEAGGAKVMQGKESISLDLGTEEGRRIVHELARRSDIVLQAFRAGAAERAGVDAATLRALNPELIYLNAPGYGTGGPYGARPAYAPSIGAASGLALTEAPDAAAATGSIAEIKAAAVRLNSATAVPTLQADGMAALGVASALLLGLLARTRDRPLGTMTTTMVGTVSHALLDHVIDYPGRPASPVVDPGGYGLSALYRMYEASDGWVFLAAPAVGEWADLVAALATEADLDEERFASADARRANDEQLAEVLADVCRRRPAAEWEERLTAAGVGCVVVTERAPELLLQTDEELAAEYCVTATSPVFDEYLRLAPTVRLSRSATRAEGGCMAGEHTDTVLRELGYDDARIAGLREDGIVS
jgi:crotonobetainyl-CoA:carnitine CoA-transferase CaiB-like acyl-CoA transferase